MTPKLLLFNKYELVDLQESNERIQKSSENIFTRLNLALGCLQKVLLSHLLLLPYQIVNFTKIWISLLYKILKRGMTPKLFSFNNYDLVDLQESNELKNIFKPWNVVLGCLQKAFLKSIAFTPLPDLKTALYNVSSSENTFQMTSVFFRYLHASLQVYSY